MGEKNAISLQAASGRQVFKDEKGYTLVLGKCSCCKRCKIYLDGPARGTCIYGGPFAGYEKDTSYHEGEKEQIKAIED